MNVMIKAASAFALACVSTTSAFAGDLKIVLEGVVAGDGDLYVSIQNKDEFLQPRGSYGEIVKDPDTGKRVLVIKDVAPGYYSVSIWHDVNGDAKFNMDARGIPLDGWSMVKADQLRGAPTWEQSRFSVPASGAEISLKMIYAPKQ